MVGGQHVLSHGSNLSAGVTVLFSHSFNMNILSSTEIVAGRFLIIRVEIHNIIFNLIIVYAQNQGPEWVTLFKLLKNKLGSVGQGECVIMGGIGTAAQTSLWTEQDRSSILSPPLFWARRSKRQI